MKPFSILRKLFPKKAKTFPQDMSWIFKEDETINWKNINSCKEFIELSQINNPDEENLLKTSKNVVLSLSKLFKGHGCHFSTHERKTLVTAALFHKLPIPTVRKMLYNESIQFREEVCWLVAHYNDFDGLLFKDYKYANDVIINLSKGNSTVEKLAYIYLAVYDNSNSHSLGDFFYGLSIAGESHCLKTPYKDTVNSDKQNFTMYVMIGFPGSGKDTYISKFLRNNPVICRDDIREEIFDGQIQGRKLYLSPKDEELVTSIVNERIKNCCLHKASFVINQTSLKKSYRKQFNDLAYKYSTPRIVYIYIEAPSIEECIKRRGGGKWEGIINKMYQGFDFPERGECDELIVIKQ